MASTLPELLAESVAKNPAATALLFGDQRWSYAEFQNQVGRIAAALTKLGIKKHDKIAFFLPNTPEFLFAVFAAAQIGAVFVPINTAYTAEEAEYVLHHSDASVVLTVPEFLALINAIRARLSAAKHVILLGESRASGTLAWKEFLSRGNGVPVSPSVHREDLASNGRTH